jgi:hypothetical protein
MSDDPSEAITVNLCPGNLKTKKKKMWKELFGKEKDADCCVSLSDVRLPRHPVKPIDRNKVRSLAKKYDTVPVEDRHYYPSVDEFLDSSGAYYEDDDDESEDVPGAVGRGSVIVAGRAAVASSTKKRKVSRRVVAPGVRKKMGRPKAAIAHDSSQRTLLGMFSPTVN